MRHSSAAFPFSQWLIGSRQHLQLRGQLRICTGFPFTPSLAPVFLALLYIVFSSLAHANILRFESQLLFKSVENRHRKLLARNLVIRQEAVVCTAVHDAV